MKRAAVFIAVLVIAAASFAQSNSQSTGQNPPAAAQQGTAGQAQAPATGQAPAKRPPQAKTQPEYDAFQKAMTLQDPAQMEAAANDFAAKFPDSELRVLLYKNTMRAFQSAGNTDKMAEMGRKVLSIDPDDPEALVLVANSLTEHTRDTDLDKDQRLEEAMKLAQRATQTVDTDVSAPAGTPQEKIDAYKGLLRSNAYSIMGTLQFNKGDFPAAEANFHKSIDAFPQQPDPVVVLRLALSLDKQNKYPEALQEANKAVEMTQENTSVGGLARKERDRLVQLTGGSIPPAKSPSGTSGAATQPPQK
ncbi:MAG TPA: tetratricopeptide repeat protein [Terriglobales bacterium]|nr:tetratricopeptide repeat protein [Terriglobales bacterium]